MIQTKTVAFAGYSGSGKTTLVERIVVRLKHLGFRVAVIKHDGHDYEIDREGKDSWRFTRAGADMSIICSAKKTAVIEQRELSISDLLNRVHDVDIILVEGFKNADLWQIGVSRKDCGKGLPHAPERYAAIVTDEDIDTIVPCFFPDDIHEIVEFILSDNTGSCCACR